jgi:hypothetical protein
MRRCRHCRPPVAALLVDLNNASTLARRNEVKFLAFEMLDDSWPDAELFQALVPLDKTQPTATILRIMHKTGSVQFWTLSEVLEHFQIDEPF